MTKQIDSWLKKMHWAEELCRETALCWNRGEDQKGLRSFEQLLEVLEEITDAQLLHFQQIGIDGDIQVWHRCLDLINHYASKGDLSGITSAITEQLIPILVRLKKSAKWVLDRNKNYEHNVRFLPARIVEAMNKVLEDDLWKNIRVQFTNELHPICKVLNGETWISLTSSAPIQEAEAWINNSNIQNNSCLFIYGCGGGYPLFNILSMKDTNTFVVIFEENIYLFKAMLYLFDFEELLTSGEFVFIIGDADTSIAQLNVVMLQGATFRITHPTALFTLPAKRVFKDYYKMFHSRVFQHLELKMASFGNDPTDNLIGFTNTIANVEELLSAPSIKCLKDQYKHVPAFIIANGPSLDKNIQQLKKVKNKGVILCAESAILPLMENGIYPDAICVLERIEHSYHAHFENIEYPEDMTLFGLSLIDSRIYSSFKGEKLPIYRKQESMSRWVNGVISDGDGVIAGRSSAHLAYDMAEYLGADPIVLVGQDCAFGKDGSHHSQKSIYYQKEDQYCKLREKPVEYVESNEGEWIATKPLWNQFRMDIEERIIRGDRVVINATEGGAKIKGALYQSLEDAIKQYCQKEFPVKISTLIERARKGMPHSTIYHKKQELLDALTSKVEEFKEIQHISDFGCNRCIQLLAALKQGQPTVDIEKIEEALNIHFELFVDFLRGEVFPYFFQQVTLLNFDQINRLGNLSSRDDLTRAIEIQQNWFEQISLIAESLIVSFNQAIQSIKRKK